MTWPTGWTALDVVLPDNLSCANAISADGSVAVGFCETVENQLSAEACYWTVDGGLVRMGLPAGVDETQATGVNDDGSVITGVLSLHHDPMHGIATELKAFRWTSGGGTVDIGSLNLANLSSTPVTVSGDGQIVAATKNTGVYETGDRAAIWTQFGGWGVLGLLAGYTSAIASQISRDGHTVVGTAINYGPPWGSRAVFWYYGGPAVDICTLPGSDFIGVGVSEDGAVIAGYYRAADFQFHGFRWTSDTGMVDIGLCEGSASNHVYGLSPDGSVIVGQPGNITQGAFISTAADGMVPVDAPPGFGTSALRSALVLPGAIVCPGQAGIQAGVYVIGPPAAPPPAISISAALTRKMLMVQPTLFGFAVTRVGDLSKPSTVTWVVAGAGGQPATDVNFFSRIFPSGTLNFAAGEATQYLEVPLINAGIIDGLSFSVTITVTRNGTLGVRSVRGIGLYDPERPMVFLECSDDRGRSYGEPVGQSMGRTGEYRTSVQWRRLGMARDRVFRLSWSVPAPTALQGAWLEATPAGS